MHRLAAVLLALAVLAGACSSGKKQAAAVPPPLYVAVGASETVGVGADHPDTEAWPTVFARTALPAGSKYVNVGISGATVQEALDKELARAQAEKPTVVTVWLNVNDMIAFVSADTYAGRLKSLVHQLRQGGRARVLVANVPPLDRLPAFTDRLRSFPLAPTAEFVNATTDRFNQVIAQVVKDEGAELVDLHAFGLAERAAGTELQDVSGDGFHPSTRGHKVVAEQFAQVYAKRHA
jgi:lysophospholipase L1-like esterase